METIQGKMLEDAAGTTSQMQSAEILKGLNENMREAQPDTDLFSGVSKPIQQKPAKAKPRTCQYVNTLFLMPTCDYCHVLLESSK